jgi:hypothetical protein
MFVALVTTVSSLLCILCGRHVIGRVSQPKLINFVFSCRYAAAEIDCTLALELDGNYLKAYLRRGTARCRLKEFTLARHGVLGSVFASWSSYANTQLLIPSLLIANTQLLIPSLLIANTQLLIPSLLISRF